MLRKLLRNYLAFPKIVLFNRRILQLLRCVPFYEAGVDVVRLVLVQGSICTTDVVAGGDDPQ